jgi:endonuclease YncB( thermonuclease family)
MPHLHSRSIRPAALLPVALLLLALTGSALAEQLKVVSISDGDTFTGLDSENRQVKVRLHGIDAPEKAQPFGNVSRKALGDLIEGKTVEVQQVDKDRYGRVVANVHVGGVHVNRELVAKGLVWRYVQYDKKGEFTQVEQAAKAARKGLWGDANPVPPWEWRMSAKERRAAKKGAGVGR